MKTSTPIISVKRGLFRTTRFAAVAGLLMAASLVGTPDSARAAHGDMMSMCATPPFVQGGQAKPNVMLFVDNSWSMGRAAYLYDQMFDPTTQYVGYFDPKKCYSYSGSSFQVGPDSGGSTLAYLNGVTTSVTISNDSVCTDSGYPWSGNFLNWGMMSRLEVVKEVLVGGHWDGNSKDGLQFAHFPSGNVGPLQFKCVDPAPYTPLSNAVGVHMDRTDGDMTVSGWDDCSQPKSAQINNSNREKPDLRIDQSTEPRGIIHELGVEEARWSLAHFNNTDPKEGAEVRTVYGYDPVSPAVSNAPDMVEIIRHLDHNESGSPSAADKTPQSAAYHALVGWHAQAAVTGHGSIVDDPTFGTKEMGNAVAPGTFVDPWWEWETTDSGGNFVTDRSLASRGTGYFVHCRKSNVLWLGDGASANDQALDDWDKDENEAQGQKVVSTDDEADLGIPWPPANHPDWPEDPGLANNARPHIDDAAFCGNRGGVNSCVGTLSGDLRPESDLDGDGEEDLPEVQNLKGYFIFAFGATNQTAAGDLQEAGPYFLYHAAIRGEFTDIDGDGYPYNVPPDGNADWNEFDEDGDDEPDGFFFANNGQELKEAITKALAAILTRTASGTNIAVLSQSGEGEAAVFQAYFDPEFEGESSPPKTATWAGFLRGLWLDKFGNLREDSSDDSASDSAPDGNLVLTEDKIVEYWFNATEEETFVRLYEDSDGDGNRDALVASKKLSDLSSIFEAGEVLHSRDPVNRKIFTTDSHNGNMIPFTPTGLSGEPAFSELHAGADATDVIHFIRGCDDGSSFGTCGAMGSHADWRKRTITRTPSTGNSPVDAPWKLGDIIYSTPTVVGAPPSRFDQLYGWGHYGEYFDVHANRPQVVYSGANDGMLHAFNVGRFHNGGPNCKEGADACYDPDHAGSPYTSYGQDLTFGTELWGFIPYAALARLQFLKDSRIGVDDGDCHIYYVDGAPNIYDMRIFPEDDIHVNGWGTVLVGTTRLGCGDTDRSVLFVLDITDPYEPEFLYEFWDADLDFTTAQPVLGLVKGRWQLYFGAGPEDTDFSEANVRPHFFVLDFGTDYTDGITKYELDLPGSSSPWAAREEIVNRPVAIDLGFDGDVDILYVTTNIMSGSDFDGRVYRIKPRNSSDEVTSDASTWQSNISVFYKSEAPFSTAPRFAMDDNGQPWIFVGTGRFYSLDDLQYREQQRFIGIKDSCLGSTDDGATGHDDCNETDDTFDESDLVLIPGDCVLDETGEEFEGGSCSVDTDGSSSTLNQPGELCTEVEGAQGWTVEFPNDGERNISRSIVSNQVVIFSSFVPPPAGGQCEGGGGGTSRIYFTDYKCGITFAVEEPEGKGSAQVVSMGSSVGVADSTGQIKQVEKQGGSDNLSGVQLFMTPISGP